jgi:hypothetical protein
VFGLRLEQRNGIATSSIPSLLFEVFRAGGTIPYTHVCHT